MPNKILYVDASFSLLNEVRESYQDLGAAIVSLTGTKLRRADRFSQLAVLGATSCCQSRELLRPSAAIVLSTSAGTLSTAVNMMTKIGVERQPPKPFQFINSFGNSACYFLARILGTHGASIVVSQEQCSFESGLLHAGQLLNQKPDGQVLVGGVDEALLPLDDHLRRHNRVNQTCDACYEGSHWLLLSGQVTPASFAKINILGSFVPEGANISDEISDFVGGSLSDALRLYNSESMGIGESNDRESILSAPRAQVVPHGVYSGHNIERACQLVRSGEHCNVVIVTCVLATKRLYITSVASV